MKFGIFDQNDATGRPLDQQFEERLTLAKLYEDCGFYCYQMSEHHGTPLSTAPSPSVFLAALSQRTSTLRFGSLVYLLPLYHPMRLAEEICMLDQLSKGRFEFGVGRGASPHELNYLGVNEECAPGLYAEAFDIIRQALTQGVLNFQGKHWSFDNVELSVRPFQNPHPPIWYAAGSADSAAWPAKNGLNLICAGPVERVRAITDRYRAERTQMKGSTSANLLAINRYIFVADTDNEARAIANRAWPTFHRSFWKLWLRHGGEPKTFKVPSDLTPMVESGFAVVGSAETVRRSLAQQVQDSGVNYVSGTFAFGDLTFDEVAHSVRTFSREVMPTVRDAYTAVRHKFEAAA
jgi:alkanesulfonate monooxygenase SsuD/methylene tetrahydromethanopterin reductase-like flavin-dependent oxidoreductase (luciferase family)